MYFIRYSKHHPTCVCNKFKFRSEQCKLSRRLEWLNRLNGSKCQHRTYILMEQSSGNPRHYKLGIRNLHCNGNRYKWLCEHLEFNGNSTSSIDLKQYNDKSIVYRQLKWLHRFKCCWRNKSIYVLMEYDRNDRGHQRFVGRNVLCDGYRHEWL